MLLSFKSSVFQRATECSPFACLLDRRRGYQAKRIRACTVLTVKLTLLDNYFKDALSFKWTLCLWILYKDPAILCWRSFIKSLANASVHNTWETDVTRAHRQNRDLSKKWLGYLFLFKPNRWLMDKASMKASLPSTQGPGALPNQHLVRLCWVSFPDEMGNWGKPNLSVKFVFCCVSRFWKWIWEQIDKWKEFVNHRTADQCVNTLIDRAVKFPTSCLFPFLANNPALSCLGKWWGTKASAESSQKTFQWQSHSQNPSCA